MSPNFMLVVSSPIMASTPLMAPPRSSRMTMVYTVLPPFFSTVTDLIMARPLTSMAVGSTEETTSSAVSWSPTGCLTFIVSPPISMD